MSELVIGVMLILGLFTGTAAVAGLTLNLVHMFTGSAGVNPAYAIAAVLLILAWRNAGYLGLTGSSCRECATGSVPVPAQSCPRRRRRRFRRRPPQADISGNGFLMSPELPPGVALWRQFRRPCRDLPIALNWSQRSGPRRPQ